MLQTTILQSSAHNSRLLLILGIMKNSTKRLLGYNSQFALTRTVLVSFADQNGDPSPSPSPWVTHIFPPLTAPRAGCVPWAMRSFTSRSTGVETTDLVRTNTFSKPITTTKYGNISLEETEPERRMRSLVKRKGRTQAKQQTQPRVKVRNHDPVP